jgi:hypothetical protein
MKPTSAFKLSGTFKKMVALTKGTDAQRNGWKRMFIDAQLSAEHATKTAGKKSKDLKED